MNGKSIAIDFDGVIHKYSKAYHDGTIYDTPIEGARDALRLLKKKGYKVVCFTARDDVQGIMDWMKANRIEVDEVTNKKPRAVVYIGRWMHRFTGNWEEITGPPVTDKELALKEKYKTLPKEASLLTDTEWGYIGGLVDGEGCITGGITTGKNIYIRLMITNQHKDVLDWLKKSFGGSIHKAVGKDGQIPVYQWNKSGIGIQPILEKLLKLNCLKMKDNQAKLAIEFFEESRYNGRSLSDFQKVSKAQQLEAIQNLNQHGIADIQPIHIDDRAIRFTNWRDMLNYF